MALLLIRFLLLTSMDTSALFFSSSLLIVMPLFIWNGSMLPLSALARGVLFLFLHVLVPSLKQVYKVKTRIDGSLEYYNRVLWRL
jgi:hypothetical protein